MPVSVFTVNKELNSPHLCGQNSMSSVLQQAQAEKLTLLVADSKSGYFGVYLSNPGQPKPYQARVRRGGKKVYLGNFATAEEAALHVARTPEGQAAAAERAAAAVPLTSWRRGSRRRRRSCRCSWPITARATSACTSPSPAYPSPIRRR